MKDPNNNAVIACEIKLSVSGCSEEEIRQILDLIHEACKANDYKLEVNFSGEFFNVPCT